MECYIETLANLHISKQQHHHRKMEKEKPIMTVNKSNSALNQFYMRQENVKRTGSFGFGQKLRESKWFDLSELGIFCAVVESGFIVEQKHQDETRYGIAIWSPGYEKSKNPEFLTIFTITETKGRYKVLSCTVADFWPESTTVRINNKCDKTETPLIEEEIRNQIVFAQNTKRKWHNTEHFAYFCRYGPVQTHFRMRKITDQLRWNTSNFFTKIRSFTAK